MASSSETQQAGSIRAPRRCANSGSSDSRSNLPSGKDSNSLRLKDNDFLETRSSQTSTTLPSANVLPATPAEEVQFDLLQPAYVVSSLKPPLPTRPPGNWKHPAQSLVECSSSCSIDPDGKLVQTIRNAGGEHGSDGKHSPGLPPGLFDDDVSTADSDRRSSKSSVAGEGLKQLSMHGTEQSFNKGKKNKGVKDMSEYDEHERALIAKRWHCIDIIRGSEKYQKLLDGGVKIPPPPNVNPKTSKRTWESQMAKWRKNLMYACA